jgi:hypothetical protein
MHRYKEVVMRDRGIELAVGESIRVQNHILTVLEVGQEAIRFSIEQIDAFDEFESGAGRMTFHPIFAEGFPPR